MSALTTDTAEDLAAIADGKGILCIMDRTGDTRQMWDPNSPDEVAVAQAAYDEAVTRGMVGYKVQDDGGKGERIRSFDPEAGKIIMAPALVGG